MPQLVTGEGCRISDGARIVGDGQLVLGDYVTIEDHVLIDLSNRASSRLVIRSRSKIKFGAVLRTYGSQIEIGPRVSIGEYTLLAGHGGITIGANVIIANHCSLNASEHIMGAEAPIRHQGERHMPIEIRSGAWIGAGVTVMAGTTIEEGAVVGANSTVTRDVRKDSVNFGSPARQMKSTNRQTQR